VRGTVTSLVLANTPGEVFSMSSFISIVVLLAVVLGLGMLRERRRERNVRDWIAKHGGTFHWPFVPEENAGMPAKELTMLFDSQGAHQWAAAIEHREGGNPLWLIEY
jgi:hypothetical protein